jgi:AcrR family transcriptional regulator
MPRDTTRNQRMRAASSERREREKQELRQAILDAARQLFLANGYEGLSLRQVAEQIGYTPTTIYLYFADKDDLLFAVVDQAYEQFTADLQRAYDSTADPRERLRALAEAYIAFGRRNPEAYQVMFMQRPDFLLKWKAGTRRPRSTSLLILKHAVQQAQEAGVVRPGNIDALSDVFWAAVHGAVSLAIAMPQLFGNSGHAESFAVIVDAALRGASR